MEDLHARRRHARGDEVLLEQGVLHGDCMTVTGKTLAENLRDLPGPRGGPGT